MPLICGVHGFYTLCEVYIALGCALRNTYNCTQCTNPNTLYRNLHARHFVVWYAPGPVLILMCMYNYTV